MKFKFVNAKKPFLFMEKYKINLNKVNEKLNKFKI